jgi:hypothetical protein
MQSGHVLNETFRKTLMPVTVKVCVQQDYDRMKDLTNPAWIKAKGLLFLLLGLLAATLLLLERPTLRVAVLLLIATWSFCRFYYFAFYVLERYVDPSYRFSGILSLAGYLLRNSRRKS